MISQLAENSTYYFKIQSEYDSGIRGAMSDVSDPIQTEIIVPSKPEKPVLLNATSDSVELEWPKITQGVHNIADIIILYRSSDDLSDQWMSHKVTKEETIVSGLKENTTYYFKIHLECITGIVTLESVISDPITTKVIAPSKPGIPRPTCITHDSIQLEWTEPEKGANNITAHTVFYLCKGAEWRNQLQKIDPCRNKVVVSNLLPNTTYYFKIRPVYKGGVGEESDISESITTKLGLLDGQLINDDLQLVINEVWEARNKWFHIGIELHMKESDLQAIKCNTRGVGNCLTEMIAEWLRHGRATWKALISALRNTTVHCISLADSIDSRLASNPNPDPEMPACSASTDGIGFRCPTECGKCSIEQYLGGECIKFASVSEPAFPYLHAKNLTRNEKVTLKSKLMNENKAIMTKFSNLVMTSQTH